MKEIKISANELVLKLLQLAETETVCLLDSCGVNHLDSHLLIAGIAPLEVVELSDEDIEKTLHIFNNKLNDNTANIFTLSYDFGLRLEKTKIIHKETTKFTEPDIFIASFDCLIIHDYNLNQTFLKGNESKFDKVFQNLMSIETNNFDIEKPLPSKISSNFSKFEYTNKVKEIQEYILKGDTYQTNLTQQFTAILPENLSAQQIFWNLRKNHPAPFASFIKRKTDFVVSISPERLAHIEGKDKRKIKTSPIKGTRPRGNTSEQDFILKSDLLNSYKDRAENTMIVDLLRNDIGRICEFGTVNVDKLCDLEEHPSLFHLVSTISGILRKEVDFTDIIKAVFPCGSITGCPKFSTMEIIEKIETAKRGLSMGAIGYCGFNKTFDLNVAIRTMVINEKLAKFNVGGGIVIDSVPDDEYEESLTKAKALLHSIGIKNY